MDNQSQSAASTWEACSEGTFRRLSRSLRRRRQRRQFFKVAGIAAVVLAGGGLAYWAQMLSHDDAQPPDPMPGGLTCAQARGYAERFARQQLPAELARRVRQHVHNCRSCSQWFAEHGIDA